MRLNVDKTVKGGGIMYPREFIVWVSMLARITIWGFIGWIAYHFISKWW